MSTPRRRTQLVPGSISYWTSSEACPLDPLQPPIIRRKHDLVSNQWYDGVKRLSEGARQASDCRSRGPSRCSAALNAGRN